ncbi:MAG: pseudaminic acid synthase [Candidatus Omnitrophica bacterium]|nr:pseudaminic acid synthase [Candidatus Omnitrophota bacterium]
MEKEKIKIGKRLIGEKEPAFIVAELSANHAQNFNLAVKTIRMAKEMGADAIKLQTYTPDTMTIDAANKYFVIRHPKWGGQTLYKLYKKAYTPWAWFKRLKKVADDEGIVFFSTAFDRSAVDLLEGLNVPIHKVASFELTDLPLIEYMAKTGKPLILSTGMATIKEINDAVKTAKNAGAGEIALLKCVSSYPAKPKDMHLRTILDMTKRFGCVVGLSDHTLGVGVSIAAVSIGARIIEKHFTLSRRIKSPDSFFSIEPQELRILVDSIRVAEESLGRVSYEPRGEEKNNRIFRRSLFAVKDIKKDEVLTNDNIRSIRPGFGLYPKYLKDALGKIAKRNIKKGTPLNWGLMRIK